MLANFSTRSPLNEVEIYFELEKYFIWRDSRLSKEVLGRIA